MPDHVHILVSIPPKYSVAQFVGYLKGKSALMIFDRHANLKYKFGTIKKYIQEQEKHDIAMDRLNQREWEDPFKG